MPNNVDERIVAAKFDASDFEKGVNKTIKKLDELKKSLDLKEATKGVKELAEKTEVSTDSMSKSLDKLTDRFTNFAGMIKQRILGGLADEVAGIFLKMEQSVTGFIKSISSEQVSAGMNKYQSMLTSVRQMVNSGFAQEDVYKTLERTQKYSDETSYSFEQMADAMSKMTAAGVDLETAGKAVEGIANACADAGINANDASRAFFNLSQAYSKGKLEYTDYRSLELLNMTTKTFKEQMLEAAVAAGTLTKKTDKLNKTIYTTTNKKDKKVKSGKKINLNNLSDMLRYDWMNTEAMNNLFGSKYWMEVIDKDELAKLRKELGDEEFEKRFGKIASQAYQAAYEARSFLDVINAIKDSVSSGWSQTFQFLFGKLDDAKEFFTDLANSELADVVYKIGEYRNAILGFWDETHEDGGAGGDVFRQTILNISEALGTLLKTFLQVLPGFDELEDVGEKDTPILQSLGDKMFFLSMHIRDLSVRIKSAVQDFNKFMNSPIMEDGPTRIEMIRNIFSNLSKVFGIIGKLALIAFNGISKAFYTIYPIFDGLLQVINKITQPLVALNDNTKVFNDIQHSINNILDVLNPIADVLGKVIGFLSEVAGFFAQMAIDTVTSNISFFSDSLGLLLEIFTGNSSQLKNGEGILNGIRRDFEGIKEACKSGLNAVKDFFGALLGDIRRLFGLTDEAEKKNAGEEGGIFAGLTKFFETNEFVQNAKAWVNQAIINIGNFIKSIPKRVMSLGANIYDTITGLLFKDETKYNGSMLETRRIYTPLGKWFNQAVEDIKKWFSNLPQNIINAVGKVGNWIDELFDHWFGKRTVNQAHYENTKTGWVEKETMEIESRFSMFIMDLGSSITNWINDIPNKIKNLFKNIGDFSSMLFKSLDEFLFGKKVRAKVDVDEKGRAKFATVRYKTGFSKFLNIVITEIKKFVTKIPDYIKAGIKGVGDIMSTIINALFGKKDDKEVTSKDVEESLEKPFLGINLTNILNTIKDIGSTILNQIARMFTGTEEVEKNQEWFSETIATGIEWIRDKAQKALKWVLDFFVNLPENIANIFKGESAENKEQGPVGRAISGFGSAIGKFITEDLPNAIFGFVNSAITTIGDLWDRLYKGITGEADEKGKDAVKYAEDEFGYPKSYAHRTTKTGWEKFVENLGNTISHAFTELPAWIAKGIHMAIEGISGLFGTLTDWLSGENAAKEMQEAAAKAAENVKETVTEVTEATTEGTKEAAKETDKEQKSNGLLEAIKGIGQTMYNLITITVPGFIKEAWKWISTKASGIWEGISSIFTGNVPESEEGKAVKGIADKIRGFINGAIQSISSGNKQEDPFEKYVANLPNSDYVQTYVDKMKKDTHGTSPFMNFVSNIGTSLVKAFENIGPIVLTGLAKALDFLGDIASLIINALTGKKSIGAQVEEVYGKEKPELRQALAKVGESLRKFFLESIPQFIGSAIGTMVREAPEWFSQLFGGIKAAAEKESDATAKEANKEAEGDDPKKAVENATSLIDLVMGFIDKIKLTTLGAGAEAIGFVIVLTLLFKQIAKLFSAAETVESIGYTMKWVALTIAFSSIAGFLSFIGTLVENGDTGKMERFNTIMDRLGEVFEKVKWLAGIIAGGKLVDAIGSFFDMKGAKNGAGSDAEGLGGLFKDGLAGFANNFLKTLGIASGVDISAKLFSSATEVTLNTISDAFMNIVSGVDGFLDGLNPIIDELDKMNSKLDNAYSAIDKIGQMFGKFYSMFDTMYTELSGKEVKEGANGLARYITKTEQGKTVAGPNKALVTIEAFKNELRDRLELFIELSQFITNIATALGRLNDVDDMESNVNKLYKVISGDGSSFKDFLTKLLLLLKDATEAAGMASKDTNMTQYLFLRNSGMAAAIDIIADTLTVFSTSISGFDESNIEAYEKALDVLAKFAEALSGADVTTNVWDKIMKGQNSLSVIGREIKLFAWNVKGFYDAIIDIPGFKSSEVKTTEDRVSSITQLTKGITEALRDITNFGQDYQYLDYLGERLPGFASACAQFFTTINDEFPEDLTVDRSEAMSNMINGIANLLYSLGQAKYSSTAIIDSMKALSEGIRGPENVAALASSIIGINQAIGDAITDKNYTGVLKDSGTKLAKVLFEGIQLALDTDPELQPKITPVLELGPARDQLRQFFGIDQLGPISLGNLAAAATGLNTQTDADRVRQSLLDAKLDEVTTAINTLSQHQVSLTDLTTAFSNMKIVTDTGVLAGEMTQEIDARIGANIWLIQQQITPVYQS